MIDWGSSSNWHLSATSKWIWKMLTTIWIEWSTLGTYFVIHTNSQKAWVLNDVSSATITIFVSLTFVSLFSMSPSSNKGVLDWSELCIMEAKTDEIEVGQGNTQACTEMWMYSAVNYQASELIHVICIVFLARYFGFRYDINVSLRCSNF